MGMIGVFAQRYCWRERVGTGLVLSTEPLWTLAARCQYGSTLAPVDVSRQAMHPQIYQLIWINHIDRRNNYCHSSTHRLNTQC